MVLLSVGTENYFMAPLHWYERILAIGGAIALLYPGTLSDVGGMAVLVLLWVLTKARAKKA